MVGRKGEEIVEGVDEQVLKMGDAIRQLEDFNSKMKEANDLIDRLASKGVSGD